MVTLALYAILAIALIGSLFLLGVWILPAGEQIADPVRDEPIWTVPAGRRLGPDDVAGVRLPVALRGYRFAETDQLLDRLVEELRTRDEELSQLRATAAAAAGDRVAPAGATGVGTPPGAGRAGAADRRE